MLNKARGKGIRRLFTWPCAECTQRRQRRVNPPWSLDGDERWVGGFTGSRGGKGKGKKAVHTHTSPPREGKRGRKGSSSSFELRLFSSSSFPLLAISPLPPSPSHFASPLPLFLISFRKVSSSCSSLLKNYSVSVWILKNGKG